MGFHQVPYEIAYVADGRLEDLLTLRFEMFEHVVDGALPYRHEFFPGLDSLLHGTAHFFRHRRLQRPHRRLRQRRRAGDHAIDDLRLGARLERGLGAADVGDGIGGGQGQQREGDGGGDLDEAGADGVDQPGRTR